MAQANTKNLPQQETDTDTPQVSITENGDLKVVSEPSPTMETTQTQATETPLTPEQVQTTTSTELDTTKPVIPHQNGSSIDGVMPQAVQPQVATAPQTTQPVVSTPQQAINDPNSISL
jgi:hypothetical protein